MQKRFPRKKQRAAVSPAPVTKSPGPRESWTTNWAWWLPRILLIVGLTLVIYWPALEGKWIWDDEWYLPDNPLMRNVAGLYKFWFVPGSWVEFYPLEETVLWSEWQLWENNTLGYHLVNVSLHILNALLVWRLLAKFKLRWAWVGGLLFAVHPVQVESVAWISELKNVLSLPCFLLALGCWMDYEESAERSDYLKTLGLFLIAMLCKIGMSPFPFLILLYAWWKRGRISWRDVLATVPFFVVSLELGLATIRVGKLYASIGHALPENIPLGGFLSRLAGAGLNLAVYLSRCFWPDGMILGYPQWKVDSARLIEYTPWVVAMALFGWFWMRRASWGRHVILGSGFFLLFLGPFLGFNAISYMTFTWVMDHYLYLPMIGLIGLVVAGLGDLEGRLSARSRTALMIAVAVLTIFMTATSRSFAALYVNKETFWSHVLQTNPDSWIAHENLGTASIEQGRPVEAMAHFTEVERLNPDFDEGYYNMGVALEKLGRDQEAVEQYRTALTLNDRNFRAYLNLGEIMMRTGNLQVAVELFHQAIRLNPYVAKAHYNMGSVQLKLGFPQVAAPDLAMAVRLDPSIAEAHHNYGVALASLGHLPEAIGQFQAAIQLRPGYVSALDNLGQALEDSGRAPEAAASFEEALRYDPTDAKARMALGRLRGQGTPVK